MTTSLCCRFAVCLSLACFACKGDDDPKTGASTTAPEPTVAPLAPLPSATSSAVDPMTPPVEAMPTATPEGSTSSEIPLTPELAATGDAPRELSWRPCGQFDDHDLQCAEVEVPIDYSQPDGGRLLISVRRIEADPLEPYHGALLFNPGGPGGEGVDEALQLYTGGIFNEIAPGYDIVGFDPRGVSASGERGCGILPPDPYPAMATVPADDRAFLEGYVADKKARGEQCEAAWGPLFRHLGSNNVVRDLEEIRKALKEPVLNFYGGSYGTRLGALYAHDYPETTGRIVLDASVSPQASFIEFVRGQFYQAIALHEQLFKDCESAKLTCPANARTVFDQVLANADKRGLKPNFVNLWAANLAQPSGVRRNVSALAAEAATPGGDGIFSFFPTGPGGVGFSDVTNASVHCTDDTLEPPTIDQLLTLANEFGQASPLFVSGYVLGAALCAGWPSTRDPVPLPTATQARPLLVIGGTQDALTPLPWAQAMTEALGSATLLISNHYGHGALLNGGDCYKQTVRAYLTSGSMPAAGTTCQ